jgi:hypothetical protein
MYLELTILDGKKAEKTVEDIRQVVAGTGTDYHRRIAAAGATPKRGGPR